MGELMLATEYVGDGCVVTAIGEIDLASAPDLSGVLGEAIGGPAQRIVVDLAGVPFLDSTGLGVLVGAHKRAAVAGKTFAVCCAQRIVANALRVARLDAVIEVHATREAALLAPPAPSAVHNV